MSKQAKTGVLALFEKSRKITFFPNFWPKIGQNLRGPFFGKRLKIFFVFFKINFYWQYRRKIKIKRFPSSRFFLNIKCVDLRSTHFKKSWNFLPHIAELQEQTEDQFGNWNIISFLIWKWIFIDNIDFKSKSGA